MSAAEKIYPVEAFAHEGYSLIKMGRHLNAESAKQFREQIPHFMDQHKANLVIDCEGFLEHFGPWVQVFMALHQKVKTNYKQVRLINVSETLSRYLKSQGVDGSLKAVPNLKVALVDFGLTTQPKGIDVNFVNPFLKAAVKVLETQASTKAKAGQVYVRDARDKFMGDISGVIGLISEAFTGSVVISFPKDTFLQIMSRMIGEDCKEITKEIEDGAGELTNIIFGQAKVDLNEKGYGIKTALPSVITGQQHSISNMTRGPRMAIPFETDVGPFYVEICLST